MKRIFKILLFAALIILVFTQYKTFEHLKLDHTSEYEDSSILEQPVKVITSIEVEKDSYYVSDTIYRWDELGLGWVVTNEPQETVSPIVQNKSSLVSHSDPVELDWKVLMDIQYRLRYFKELDMEVYAPVFSKAAEALHGKEVIIEGFVIPYDESGEVLSLSYNPFASCFFCGKASPASIISLHLKNKRKRYKIDDFKKFKGILHLNLDDPNEFYYILKEAKEQ